MDAEKQLTNEQRERITQNFKAAKIIRDRKRSQMKASLPSPIPSPSAPGPCRLAAGRLSLDSSDNYAPEFRSPVLKKTNNSLSPLRMLQRKALTELKPNTERDPFALRSPRKLRSISKDILDDAEPAVTCQNHCSVQEYRQPFLSSSMSSSAKPDLTHILPLETNARFTSSSGQAYTTDGLSQTFDEALLQEIDSLCEQRSCQKEGSLQNSNFAVPKVVDDSIKDERHRSGKSIAPMTEGLCSGVVQGLASSAVVQTELFSTSPKVLQGTGILSVIAANPENTADVSAPGSELIVGSAVTDPSRLASELAKGYGHSNLAVGGPVKASGAGEVPTFATASVAIVNQEGPTHLQHLNDSQREAATSDITKPLLILAGPGSGKTSTMVARLLTLMKEGLQPANILAMTFTTAAATEMRERVATAVGRAVSKELTISTFHSFCLQICRSHADKLGRTSEFLVFGHGQQRKAVVEAVRIAICEHKADQMNAGDDNPAIWKDQARKWQQFVTKAKCAGKTPDDYNTAGNVLGAAVLSHYEKTLAACDALDYHDFITFAVNLLKDHQEVLDDYQKLWTCILVDEFQDTSTMQYSFLRLLASHNRITIVGDDDQSIFGFNGANSTGFESFRTDFPGHKEVRLHQNYRSTKCIVEAASALIKNNFKRCQMKQVFTDNKEGDRIEVRECRNEPAQCALVVDCILMNSQSSTKSSSYGSTAVLYRRQVTGKLFQAVFRARKIPFNVHGVAFYRKKVIKNITALLWTVLPGRKDIFSKRVFKALYSGEKSETKKVLEYVEKIAKSKKCDFHQAATEIFSAKISGTFNRRELALGKKVLASIRTLHHVVCKEQALSAVITAAATLLPQSSTYHKRAVVSENGGKLLNEDEDPRTVLEFLLDDVNDFLSNHYNPANGGRNDGGTGCEDGGGSLIVLKAFLDHLGAREEENFRCRRQEDKNSVTLTTMHQSKGLEWDTVFIVKANDTETPLLHEGRGCVSESSISLEEERRLFYVAMTRARKKLYIFYVLVDSQRQVLQPSRFLAELPRHLLDCQEEKVQQVKTVPSPMAGITSKLINSYQNGVHMAGITTDPPAEDMIRKVNYRAEGDGSILSEEHNGIPEAGVHTAAQSNIGANAFLKGFSVETRSVVAVLFHTWAKKPCFQDPLRLLSKVGFVIDERLRIKSNKNRAVLMSLKCVLRDEAALSYAQHVLTWEKLPAEERAVLQAERQEYFQQQNNERSLAAATATPKQISFLRSLGCTVEPTSRLHASRLIEQYKQL